MHEGLQCKRCHAILATEPSRRRPGAHPCAQTGRRPGCARSCRPRRSGRRPRRRQNQMPQQSSRSRRLQGRQECCSSGRVRIACRHAPLLRCWDRLRRVAHGGCPQESYSQARAAAPGRTRGAGEACALLHHANVHVANIHCACGGPWHSPLVGVASPWHHADCVAWWERQRARLCAGAGLLAAPVHYCQRRARRSEGWSDSAAARLGWQGRAGVAPPLSLPNVPVAAAAAAHPGARPCCQSRSLPLDSRPKTAGSSRACSP